MQHHCEAFSRLLNNKDRDRLDLQSISMRLNGKVAIITGGGSGIGKAIAQAFVREGAKGVIAGRDSNKLEAAVTEIGGDCVAISADVSSANDVQKLVSAAIEKFKRIDILVNNAAV